MTAENPVKNESGDRCRSSTYSSEMSPDPMSALSLPIYYIRPTVSFRPCHHESMRVVGGISRVEVVLSDDIRNSHKLVDRWIDRFVRLFGTNRGGTLLSGGRLLASQP